jgi:hypothetical protein
VFGCDIMEIEADGGDDEKLLQWLAFGVSIGVEVFCLSDCCERGVTNDNEFGAEVDAFAVDGCAGPVAHKAEFLEQADGRQP